MDKPTFEIIDSIGVIGQDRRNWTYELNLVSWNNRPPIYDLRSWSPDHETPGKGITLNEGELKLLYSLLKNQCGFILDDE